MTGTPAMLADLLADCEAHGIRLALADGGGLEIDTPPDALTPDLLDRLKAHKADLLARLRTESKKRHVRMPPRPLLRAELVPLPMGGSDVPQPVCRCGGTTWRDVPIHGGRSVRRDCGRCRRFLDFPVWYGCANGRQS